MKLRANAFPCNFLWVATGLAVVAAVVPAYGQRGVVTDWSTRHVLFSNPGSEMDALMNGRRQEWQNFVSNPRYRMQTLRRSPEWANRLARVRAAMEGDRDSRQSEKPSIAKDWAVQIAPAGSGTDYGMFPAEYGNFDTPSCAGDFVVFTVDAAGKSGSGGQANFVGFNNLYKGTCTTGTVPKVAFAYYVGQGEVTTSPVISVEGTKAAFIESKTTTVGTRSNLHVFTLGTFGSSSGTAYNAPATPHTIIDNGATSTTSSTNNATDEYVTLNGNPNVTRSSPFIDYPNDVAYVGDDSGKLHKFMGVFNGTLTEVTTGGWPFTVASGEVMTGPVLDSTSGNIFVGAGSNIYCIVSATPAACTIASVNVSNGTFASSAPTDPPIVDSTAGKVYSEAVATACTFSFGGTCFGRQTTESVLMQATTSLGSVVRVNMGNGGTNLHTGDFDNIYYNSATGTGHFYFCGNISSTATPELYRVTITNGTMAGSSTALYQLVTSGQTGTQVSCTPLTEADNGTTDFMFVGVQGHGSPTGCQYTSGVTRHNSGCIMSFVLPSSGTTPTAPAAEFSLGGENSGSSGFVVDNESSQAGASQIYFSNLVNGSATQASQNGLD